MLQLSAGRDDRELVAEVSEILRSLHANPRIPTLFKDPPPLCDCPDGFAQAEAFENAKQLGNRGHWLAASEQFVTLNVPYRFMGLTEQLSWLSQFAGQGFEDISALANLILLQAMMLG